MPLLGLDRSVLVARVSGRGNLFALFSFATRLGNKMGKLAFQPFEIVVNPVTQLGGALRWKAILQPFPSRFRPIAIGQTVGMFSFVVGHDSSPCESGTHRNPLDGRQKIGRRQGWRGSRNFDAESDHSPITAKTTLAFLPGFCCFSELLRIRKNNFNSDFLRRSAEFPRNRRWPTHVSRNQHWQFCRKLGLGNRVVLPNLQQSAGLFQNFRDLAKIATDHRERLPVESKASGWQST